MPRRAEDRATNAADAGPKPALPEDDPNHPMLNRVIELSLKNRVIVIGLAVALAGWGWWALGPRRSTRFPICRTTR